MLGMCTGILWLIILTHFATVSYYNLERGPESLSKTKWGSDCLEIDMPFEQSTQIEGSINDIND